MKQMRNRQKNKGSLTIEAAISVPIFMMVVVSFLFLMRIVYTYGLIQHAVTQTAKELSMYTYLYHVSGVNALEQQVQGAVSGRTEQFNQDADNVIQWYEQISSGDLTAGYDGTTNPKEIMKNLGNVILGNAVGEVKQQAFEAVVRPMLGSYIRADFEGGSADERLRALRVMGGEKGLDLSNSTFFENGTTIDLVVCYTIDPLTPIDILPELNLVNRACVAGMSGDSIFTGQSSASSGGNNSSQEEESIWDKNIGQAARGKEIQAQQGIRNLPETFPVYSAYEKASGKATAEMSVDIRDVSYQDPKKLEATIKRKCEKIENFSKPSKDAEFGPEDIRSRELIIYIPASKEGRLVDRKIYDQTIQKLQKKYPEIHMVTKAIS